MNQIENLEIANKPDFGEKLLLLPHAVSDVKDATQTLIQPKDGRWRNLLGLHREGFDDLPEVGLVDLPRPAQNQPLSYGTTDQPFFHNIDKLFQ